MDENLINQIIFKKYKIITKISNGSFGNVYLSINILTQKLFALKLEDRKNLKKKTLEKEAYYLYNLKSYGIPQIIAFGYSGRYNILIEELLGKSLYEMNLIKKFTLKDICMIGIQLIQILKYIHSKFIIHCDIKPQNVLLGKDNSSIIYLCDFGIAQKYRSSKTGKHINLIKYDKYYVTLIYSSIHSMLGYQQSRRDDLESLGYMLIYLKNGLPWEKIKFKNIEDYKNKILDLKKNLDIKKLCKGLPFQFNEYIKYVRELKFEEKPNYTYLRNLFYEILFKLNKKNDYIFSWTINKEKINIYRNSYKFSYKALTPNKSLFHNIKKQIKESNNPEFNIITRKDNFSNKNKLNDFDLINFWTNKTDKNNNLLMKEDKDLEVENNFYIDY